jgi:hypothetical protein
MRRLQTVPLSELLPREKPRGMVGVAVGLAAVEIGIIGLVLWRMFVP